MSVDRHRVRLGQRKVRFAARARWMNSVTASIPAARRWRRCRRHPAGEGAAPARDAPHGCATAPGWWRAPGAQDTRQAGPRSRTPPAAPARSCRARAGSAAPSSMPSTATDATSSPRGRTPRAWAMEDMTWTGSRTGVRSTKYVPSANDAATSRAIASARRVLPTPPVPVIVTVGAASSNRSVRAVAHSAIRPTNGVRTIGISTSGPGIGVGATTDPSLRQRRCPDPMTPRPILGCSDTRKFGFALRTLYGCACRQSTRPCEPVPTGACGLFREEKER